jgi:hypothetical protein
MTITAGPYYDPRDRTGRGPCWVVVTREGAIATHHRFYSQEQAEHYAACPCPEREVA